MSPGASTAQVTLDLRAYRAKVVAHEIAKAPFDDLDRMRREIASREERQASAQLTQHLGTYTITNPRMIVQHITAALEAARETAMIGHTTAALTDLVGELHEVVAALQDADLIAYRAAIVAHERAKAAFGDRTPTSAYGEVRDPFELELIAAACAEQRAADKLIRRLHA